MIEQFSQTVELPLWAVLGLYAYRGEAKSLGKELRRKATKRRSSEQ